eukprot:Blabericola_migrator_1__2989@NODE_1865_length_3631_cov_221_034512_g1194_i0_p4_GENE_NODE_1865_length_3631_cov_221_034512_g1194_i0NODE_1865_length_3631_cov_221_034512_g1194_i0_p4_ORF_typecomplete_len190_score35_59Ribosomal_L6/PF00347_23/2_2e16Ribosomal_L6/PF00347_23/0_00018_NODE_1865_length_3631_cov_221_034512_g1194_i017162285
MKHIYTQEEISIPEGVELTCNAREIVAKGKHGELKRSFKHLRLDITVDQETKKIQVGMWLATPTQRSIVRTFCSHVENMMKGVSKKFQYKMRLVYNHFPININLPSGGTVVELRNFLGEKRTRIVKLLPGVTCTKGSLKDELVFTGIDIENVSRSCALIHQSALVRNKDIRQFLDGAYVSERGVVETEA